MISDKRGPIRDPFYNSKNGSRLTHHFIVLQHFTKVKLFFIRFFLSTLTGPIRDLIWTAHGYNNLFTFSHQEK